MNLTVKQISILRVIAAGNEDGSRADLDQVLDRIDYETTKASIQFSIRSLIKGGMIVKDSDKRRGRQHVVYVPTEDCLKVLGKKPISESISISEEDESLLSEIESIGESY